MGIMYMFSAIVINDMENDLLACHHTETLFRYLRR